MIRCDRMDDRASPFCCRQNGYVVVDVLCFSLDAFNFRVLSRPDEPLMTLREMGVLSHSGPASLPLTAAVVFLKCGENYFGSFYSVIFVVVASFASLSEALSRTMGCSSFSAICFRRLKSLILSIALMRTFGLEFCQRGTNKSLNFMTTSFQPGI